MFTLPHGIRSHGSIVRQAFAEGLLTRGGDADGMTLVHAEQFVQLLLGFGVGYSDIATGTDALVSSVRVFAEVVGSLGRGVDSIAAIADGVWVVQGHGLLGDTLRICPAQRLNKNWSTQSTHLPKQNESMLPVCRTLARIPGQRKSPESSSTSPTFTK
jgi:hypothetical protein